MAGPTCAGRALNFSRLMRPRPSRRSRPGLGATTTFRFAQAVGSSRARSPQFVLWASPTARSTHAGKPYRLRRRCRLGAVLGAS
eukprot:5766001-Pyramimonas_sp.AAC.1